MIYVGHISIKWIKEDLGFDGDKSRDSIYWHYFDPQWFFGAHGKSVKVIIWMLQSLEFKSFDCLHGFPSHL